MKTIAAFLLLWATATTLVGLVLMAFFGGVLFSLRTIQEQPPTWAQVLTFVAVCVFLGLSWVMNLADKKNNTRNWS